LSYEILGVHVHLSKCGRGTCLSVEMQKGYMPICQNVEGVHDKQKVGNPWLKSISTQMKKSTYLQIWQATGCCFLSNLEFLRQQTADLPCTTIRRHSVVDELLWPHTNNWQDICRSGPCGEKTGELNIIWLFCKQYFSNVTQFLQNVSAFPSNGWIWCRYTTYCNAIRLLITTLGDFHGFTTSPWIDKALEI